MNKYKDALNELFVYSKHSANKVEILSLIECYEKLEQLINEHFELKEKYEKALDKACEEVMSWTDMCFNVSRHDENYGIYPNFDTVEQWKVWCLKDE